jgi:hypothetical protein
MLNETYWMHIWLPDPPPDRFTEFEKYVFTSLIIERLANHITNEKLRIGLKNVSSDFIHAAVNTHE